MLSRNLVPLEHVYISSTASSNIINFGPLEDEHRGLWNSQTFCLRDRFGGDWFAGSVALEGMKVDTIFYWSFFASPPRIQKMPASGISSELSAHQMARSEIVPASGISSELSAHQNSCARQFRDTVSPHTGRFPHVQQWARCNP